MSVTKDKYVHTGFMIEISEYNEIQDFISARGWTLAHFFRKAYRTEMDRVLYEENTNRKWHPGKA